MTRYRYRLEFETDWHVGSGNSRHGEADRLVVRDADGLPFVPATTLTGIIRDACEEVAFGLDSGRIGRWSAWVEWLFGSQLASDRETDRHDRAPTPARATVSPAQLASEIRASLRHRSHAVFADQLYWLKVGIEVDAASGVAKHGSLRVDEVVRPVELHGDMEVRCDDSVTHVAEALLWAGTRVVRRLGGMRRRGLGRCTLALADVAEPARHLEILGGDPGPPPAPEEISLPGGALALSSTGGQWLEIALVVELVRPAVIPERVLGNVVTCRSSIPGTMLLRAVLERLRPHGTDVFPAVAAGMIQVLDATPEVCGVRGLPTPLALYVEKGSGSGASSAVTNRLRESQDAVALKMLRSPFVAFVEDGDHRRLHVADPDVDSYTRNTVEDSVQMPTEAVGGVYIYQALRAPSRWRSVLRVHPDVGAALDRQGCHWRGRLAEKHPFRVGTRKKGDYGEALLYESPCDTEAKPSEFQGERIVVWLTADLLLRGALLRPTTEVRVLAEELAELLRNCDPAGTAYSITLDQEAPLAAAARHARRDGWHVGWMRPRPSSAGFAAGSCFAFRITPAPPLDVLKATQEHGLGDRRAEGYGQFRINPPYLMHALHGWSRVDSDDDTTSTSSQDEAAAKLDVPLTRMLEDLAWRAWIDEASEAFAASDRRREHLGWHGLPTSRESVPTNSQLQALWQALVFSTTPLDAVRERCIAPWKNQEGANAETWRRCGVLLDELLDERRRRWEWLRSVTGRPPPALTAHHDAGASVVRERYDLYALRTLVINCVRAEVRSRERASVARAGDTDG